MLWLGLPRTEENIIKHNTIGKKDYGMQFSDITENFANVVGRTSGSFCQLTILMVEGLRTVEVLEEREVIRFIVG